MKDFKKWENQRKLGKWNYVIFFSFGIGLIVIVSIYLLAFVINKLGITDENFVDTTFIILFYLAHSAIQFYVSLINWNRNEKHFKETHSNKDV